MLDLPGQSPIIISVEATPRRRDLIDQAAGSKGLSRADFVIEAACREAEEVVLDQLFFPLEAPAFARFMALLDHPPAPSDRLNDLLTAKADWV